MPLEREKSPLFTTWAMQPGPLFITHSLLREGGLARKIPHPESLSYEAAQGPLGPVSSPGTVMSDPHAKLLHFGKPDTRAVLRQKGKEQC